MYIYKTYLQMIDKKEGKAVEARVEPFGVVGVFAVLAWMGS